MTEPSDVAKNETPSTGPDDAQAVDAGGKPKLPDHPRFYPCGCSHLKVGVGMCDDYDETGKPRETGG